MPQNTFPSGWDEERVRGVLAHYESEPEEQADAENETTCDVPIEPGNGGK